MAAKANGLLAIDAPFGNFRDKKGLEKSCFLSAALGCDGKWAIHPGQLETINRVFSPGPEEIIQARKVLKAFENAKTGKRGALAIDGRMIDGASLRNARLIDEQAKIFEIEVTEK